VDGGIVQGVEGGRQRTKGAEGVLFKALCGNCVAQVLERERRGVGQAATTLQRQWKQGSGPYGQRAAAAARDGGPSHQLRPHANPSDHKLNRPGQPAGPGGGWPGESGLGPSTPGRAAPHTGALRTGPAAPQRAQQHWPRALRTAGSARGAPARPQAGQRPPSRCCAPQNWTEERPPSFQYTARNRWNSGRADGGCRVGRWACPAPQQNRLRQRA
jgi:hypothetical protein